MKMTKEIKYLYPSDDEEESEIQVIADFNDNDLPIRVVLAEDHSKWVSLDDAKRLVKAINTAIRSLG